MVRIPRYLLVIACSSRKRPVPEPLPALERYDGVNFRVLRKARREGHWPAGLDILVISAKYGLVEAITEIPYYDLLMTKARALQLQQQVSLALDERINLVDYDEVFVNLGKAYRVAIAGTTALGPNSPKVHFATGGIGEKMSQMKQWLLRISG